MTTLVFDCEVYKNYFLLSFLNTETGNARHFEQFGGHPFDIDTVRKILKRYKLVSFNGNHFDLPLISAALQGADCAGLKRISDKIILNNAKPWALGLEPPACDHIDLIEVAPGVASLKIYGGRLHCPKLQDLPIEPDATITPEQRELLRRYCVNDLDTTYALYRSLEKQIALREQMGAQYGIDLRSKSDAQIAEAVIRKEVEHLIGDRLPKRDPFELAGKSFHYRPPAFIEFTSPLLQNALRVVSEAEFLIGSNGVVKMPKEVASLKLGIGRSTYQMGIGGLHSTEKSEAHFSDENHILVDRDVASYYPAIILNCGLRPSHMGQHFTKVYRSIVERRLEAKRTGDKVTADSLKITINGSFGKFGSPYSVLYSPTLLIQTTVTGQLSLLMLIEALESEGIPVVSANTDGIVIKCPRSKVSLLEVVVDEWELKTGFVTEEDRYLALYSRDVNNYIAIKPNGHKLKGAYAPAGMQKNATNEICTDAVVKYLRNGTSIEETIRACDDITKFVTIRTVRGGAIHGRSEFNNKALVGEKRELLARYGWNEIDRKTWESPTGEKMAMDLAYREATRITHEVYLGKAVRWYYAKGEAGAIYYKLNGYSVARSEGARPLMDLPDELPDDIDYDWYIREAQSILRDIGAN